MIKNGLPLFCSWDFGRWNGRISWDSGEAKRINKEQKWISGNGE